VESTEESQGVLRRCAECRGYFREDELLIQTPIQVFCTKECLQKKQAKLRGKSKSTKVPKRISNAVKVRDKNRCRACGLKDRRSWPLHQHHIKYRSEGGLHLVKNLITLCVECHDRVHSNKRVFQPLLIDKVSTSQQIRLEI